MLNDVIVGISLKLNEMFGDGYKIYAEEMKQGSEEPCFFILPLIPESTNKLGHRALREYPFDIHYFPENHTKEEMYDVSEKLMLGLEYIKLLDGSLIRCVRNSMKSEFVDGVLHFNVKYSFFVNKPYEQETVMDAFDVITKGKQNEKE